jgi:monoterpene epsilon-lactone hydrolase
MASAASRRIVEQLWTLPDSGPLALDDWRRGANWREREPLPQGMTSERTEHGGVSCLQVAFGESSGASDESIAIVLHGGGFIVCTAATHQVLGATLAASAGGRAVIVDYGLAPEHPFPQAARDCVSAYEAVVDSGIDPGRIWLFGDSAGGNLCVATCLQLLRRGRRLPAAMVLASPLLDMTFSSPSTTRNASVDPFSRIDSPERMIAYYLGDGMDAASPRDPLASPLFAADAELAQLPPTYTLVGPDETLLDDATRFDTRLRAAGGDSRLEIIDGAFHTWLGYHGELPEADESISRIGRFVRQALA